MTKHGLNIFQCTEDNHRDRKDLVGAVAIMSAVAQARSHNLNCWRRIFAQL